MRAASLAIVLALAAGSAQAASPGFRPAIRPALQDADDPFAGGWSHEALGIEAEPLIKARLAGGKVAGDAALEIRLARLADPAERARVLTAYGVGLMSNLDSGAPAAALEAFPYMKRAVAEGRQGFAADSRMLAMLLSDAANTEFMARGIDTSSEAEAWLEEAGRIRERRLGVRHSETVSTWVYLADIRGMAERHRGDPARIDAVARLYEALLRVEPATIDVDVTPFFVKWMSFLAGAGRPDEACAVLDKMYGLPEAMNLGMGYAANALGEALSEAGYDRRAAPLSDGPAVSALLGEGPPADKPLRCGA